ncbi:MAG: YhjD/YihY/BrkB family envelope integrity protein [Verrucomicrobiia bacterium]
MPQSKLNTVTAFFHRLRGFFLDELPWEGRVVSPLLKKLRTMVQFVYVLVCGFRDNRCPLRAAALCYTTLLALVPMLVVAFSISKSFLRESSATVVPRVIDALVLKVAPQLEYLPAGDATKATATTGHVVVTSAARQQAVEAIQSFIGRIDAGVLGLVGTLALVLVAIQLLMTIEKTFNDIWGVQQGRSIWRQVVYYWTWITLGPLVILGAVAFTGTAEFSHWSGKLAFLHGSTELLIKLAPFVILWVGFGLLYGLMPNTRVRFHAALIGGIVGGTLWQLNSLLNTMYLSRVVTYSKIYGALGILPVFLLGVYFSWLIVLFGAQVSFAVQNVHAFIQKRASERLDQAGRELLACRIVLLAVQRFLHGETPPGREELADKLGAPLQLLNRLAARLVAGEVLLEVANTESALTPARPPESITVADVLHVIRTNDGQCGVPLGPPDGELMPTVLRDLYATARNSRANANFAELAARRDK